MEGIEIERNVEISIVEGRKWKWKEDGNLNNKWKEMEFERTWKSQYQMKRNGIVEGRWKSQKQIEENGIKSKERNKGFLLIRQMKQMSTFLMFYVSGFEMIIQFN